MIDWENLLTQNVDWYCQACVTNFTAPYPPICPNCGIQHVDQAWLEGKKREEEEYIWRERVRREREAIRREERALMYESWMLGLKKYFVPLLTKHNVALPEDEEIYGVVHYLFGRDQRSLQYFKHYAYWEPRVGRKEAHKQVQFELADIVLRAKHTGMSYQEIGALCDMSRERVRQICETERRRLLHPKNRRSPFKNWSPIQAWIKDQDWFKDFAKKTGAFENARKKFSPKNCGNQEQKQNT